MKGLAWTPAEDAVLRADYGHIGGAREVAAKLGRTLDSVHRRAQRLKIHTHARWTNDDDRRLRNLWGEYTVETIAKKLNRTTLATFQHAKEIGLKLGAPEGSEYLWHAAKRTGYPVASLRMILKRSGVEMRRTMSRPTPGPKKRPCHFVDPFEVDQAIAAWLQTETLHAGAARRGIHADALERRLRGIEGVPQKPADKSHWRIPSRILDEAVGAPLIDLRRERTRGERGKFLPSERSAA